jgi:hypothetical protein
VTRRARHFAPVAVWAGLVIATTAVPRSVQAQEDTSEDSADAAARALFEQGMTLAAEERWGEAVEFFRRARALVERPSIDFNLGISLFTLGRHVEAQAALERFLASSDATADAIDRAHAEAILVEARAAVAEVVLTVSPAEASVRVDGLATGGEGASRTLRLDPGEHRVEVAAAGYGARASDLALLPGARETLEVSLVPVAPHLDVIPSVASAEILVDGILSGIGRASLDVDIGPHRVEVRAPGYARYDELLETGPGDEVELRPALAALPPTVELWQDPWFWVVGGVLLAGLAAGIAGGVVASQPPPPYGGNSGIVIEALRH